MEKSSKEFTILLYHNNTFLGTAEHCDVEHSIGKSTIKLTGIRLTIMFPINRVVIKNKELPNSYPVEYHLLSSVDKEGTAEIYFK